MAGRRTFLGPEENAYNTPTGGHSRSGRRGRAVWPDGRIRSVTLGVPDTYFTIPAHGRIGGRYVSGYVTTADHRDEDRQTIYTADGAFPGIMDGEVMFVPHPGAEVAWKHG